MAPCLPFSLYNLKKNGFSNEELVTVYKSSVRPVVDYLDVVYHAMLPDDLDEELDRLQNQALRIIFGRRPDGRPLGGRQLREMAGVSSLRDCRVEHCDKFAKKCASSPRFGHSFPVRTTRSSSGHAMPEKFLESYVLCDRLRDSPVFFFRRRLNGKEGKVYGERNRCWREA